MRVLPHPVTRAEGVSATGKLPQIVTRTAGISLRMNHTAEVKAFPAGGSYTVAVVVARTNSSRIFMKFET
jgi:hypothetical protein